MAVDRVIVTLGGLVLSTVVAWYFWFSQRRGVKVFSTGPLQEVLIRVKGGYSPDVIVVEAGKPVRLNFRREETALCSEQVMIPAFQKQATLTTLCVSRFVS